MATLSYESLSDVPEDLRDSAKEVDGKYEVSVTAAIKIKEFRDNNVNLSKERDQLTAAIAQYEQVTGVPVGELEDGKLGDFAKILDTLRDTKKKVDDGNLVENTSLEEAAAARVTEVTQGFKAQLAEMAKDRDAHKNARDSAEKRANSMQVENAVRLAASDPDVAMHDKAVTFMMPKALETFKISDGSITPKANDGTVIYGSDGVTAMSIKEWLLKERDENDFMFQGSKGGGAQGNTDTAPGRLSAAELEKMNPSERMRYARKHQTT